MAPRFPFQAIVRVGNGGRGFIVRAKKNRRYIITAAHCIERDINQLTFSNIIGALDGDTLPIWGQLCVLSLIDDIAVFGAPASQELSDQCDAFTDFAVIAMTVAAPSRDPDAPAWVLSLDRKWQPCRVHSNGRLLLIMSGAKIKSGMSGSPILDAEGYPIGVVSTGDDLGPCLASCLPPWLWKQLNRPERSPRQPRQPRLPTAKLDGLPEKYRRKLTVRKT